MSKKKKILITVAVICVFVILEAIFVMVSIPDKLMGFWTLDEATSYQFDGRGSGVMHLSTSEYTFSYTLKNDILSIDFEDDNAVDRDYQYEVDDNRLILTYGTQIYELWKE